MRDEEPGQKKSNHDSRRSLMRRSPGRYPAAKGAFCHTRGKSLYFQASGESAWAPVPARDPARPASTCKQCTVFVDNVVGNRQEPTRQWRNHAVVSGLLKISSSEDFVGPVVRQNPDARISMQTTAMSNLSVRPDRLLVPFQLFRAIRDAWSRRDIQHKGPRGHQPNQVGTALRLEDAQQIVEIVGPDPEVRTRRQRLRHGLDRLGRQ